MDHKEHQKYLKEFQSYSDEIISSEETTKEFLVRIGVNTPTGRLTKAYSHQTFSNSNIKE